MNRFKNAELEFGIKSDRFPLEAIEYDKFPVVYDVIEEVVQSLSYEVSTIVSVLAYHRAFYFNIPKMRFFLPIEGVFNLYNEEE